MSPKKFVAPAQLSRRMFLRGAGGAALALPVLPSLLASKEAEAQAASFPKFFVQMRTPHGGVATADMWPTSPSALTVTNTTSYPYPVRSGALAAPVDAGGNAVISNVLSAPQSVLTPSLVSKMNILRGLDIPTYMTHNFGGFLGYYDANKQTPPASIARATIDQLMAYSPQFYPSLASVRQRSVAVGSSSGSYGYNTPGVPSSGVSSNSIGAVESSLGLFNTLLGGMTSSGPSASPTPLVDKILDSYNRLRNGNKRLSTADKQRLDQHITSVAELQRSLGTTLSAGCQVPPTPTTDNLSLLPMDGNPTSNVEFFTLVNQVIAVAMNCGATQIYTLSVDENNEGCTFTTTPAQGEGWHNNVAHMATSTSTAAGLIAQFNQVFFSGVYLDLVSRLNSFSDGMGGTLLDHALVAWAQECGNVTHFSFSIPVITAGSAGGAIKTGNYCDYRNLAITPPSGDSTTGTESNDIWSGAIFNQWLTTALMAMGVSWPTEPDHPGYGARVTYQSYGNGTEFEYFFTNNGLTDTDYYTDAMWQKTGGLLPFL
jgi:hypothetical protein